MEITSVKENDSDFVPPHASAETCHSFMYSVKYNNFCQEEMAKFHLAFSMGVLRGTYKILHN